MMFDVAPPARGEVSIVGPLSGCLARAGASLGFLPARLIGCPARVRRLTCSFALGRPGRPASVLRAKMPPTRFMKKVHQV